MTIEFTPEEARILLELLGIRRGVTVIKEEKPAQKRKQHPNHKGATRTIDRGKVFALAKAGWPTKKIADEMGCSVWSVRNILNNEAPYTREEEK